ncbi:hypothetical protein AB0H83_48250 [Dactylosporangium sp. NPDC050688]|uniref:hypothetical protein n=1 Tax=Dactylosporangium sp. NPDC050688 TaxID=3157217 RepID=UPI0033ED7268
MQRIVQAWYKIMMRTLRCRRRAELPPLNDGEDLAALNATVNGELVAASTPSNQPNQLRGRQARIHLYEQTHGWHQVALVGLTIDPSRVDLLPGTGYLLAQSRCIPRPYEPTNDNAQVFDGSGRPIRSFKLGDGIAHLAVDEPGTIWVGYFDEGIYSGDPLSAAGIARFDDYGRRLWSYQPPPGLDHVADCYALNAGARTTWAYYYTGFPLVRITDTQVRPFQPGPVRGARGILIHGDEVAFVGGYGKPSQLTQCRLLDDTIVTHGPVRLTDHNGRPLNDFRIVSTRGSRLFIRTDHHILEADLADYSQTGFTDPQQQRSVDSEPPRR